MQRTFVLTLTAALLIAGSVAAQNPPAQSGPNNNAINSSDQNNSNKPVAGRNSFIEGQAKSRLKMRAILTLASLRKTTTAFGAARPARVVLPPMLASIFKAM